MHCCIVELDLLILDGTERTMRGCAWIHSRGTASAGGVDPGFLRSIGGRGQVEDSIRRGPAHPDSSRISPLARDGERGWGVELDHLRPGIKRGRSEVSTTLMHRRSSFFSGLGKQSSPLFLADSTGCTTMFLFDQSESMLRVVLQRSEPHLGEHIQLAASDKRRIFSQNYKEIVKKHAMGPVHNHQVVEMRVQRLDPAHAQRAHGAPPQADTLPLNRPPGLLPLLQQPQPNGMPPYTPNGPSQMFFTGIGPPYPFPFLPPQPQSDGVLPQFPPQFPPGIFPFRPNLPGLPQWPQTIVPLGPMTVFEEKVIVTALFDAGFRGVTPKVALDALHGTQGIPAHVWKDRYLDHKEGFDALVCSLRASANPGPTAVPNPPFPQGNTTAPAAATTKTPIYSRTEQAPESKGRPSVYPSRSTPPASVNVRTVKKPHYPRIKQSPPPLPESESESEGKSSSARPARLTAHTAVYTKKLPPPSNQIRIPKTPSKEPTPPTGLTTQTSPTKFTDEEEDFFIGFILWSLQQDPGLTKSELTKQRSSDNRAARPVLERSDGGSAVRLTFSKSCSAQCRLAGPLPRLVTTCSTHCCIAELDLLILDGTERTMRCCAWIHSRGTTSAGGVDPGCLRSIGGRGQVEDSIRRGPAHPDSSRISPLARDGERGWGVELDHLRSTASAGSLTIYAGWWRASSFEDSAGPAKLCMDMVQLLQARVAQRSDPESQCEGNRENFLRQTQGTAPKLFLVSPAASTLLFARISAHREGPGPAAGRFVAGLRRREWFRSQIGVSPEPIELYIFCLAILLFLHLELWHMRSFYRYTAKAFASIYIRSNYLPNDQTHYGQVFVTVRSGGTNDASLSLQPVDKDVPTTSCTISHVDKVATTIDQENNSWEGVVERASIGLFRLRLVFASPSSLDDFLFAIRFASNSATISVLSRLLHRIPTPRTIMEAFRPMDTLPVELLAEIFIHFRQLLSSSDLTQVLLLGSVCSRWRAIAWGLNALWSQPHFRLGPSYFRQDFWENVLGPDPWTQQMLAWLRRARCSESFELRISVDRHHYHQTHLLHRFLPTVSNHLRALRLELSQPQLDPLFGATAPTFPHLESLGLVVRNLAIAMWPLDWRSRLTSRVPSLRFLILDGDDERPRGLPGTLIVDGFLKSFPWAQLVKLHINFCIPPSLWRSIIGQCTSLCAAQFSVQCMDDPFLGLREPVALTSLISLEMHIIPLCPPPPLRYPMLSTGQYAQLLSLKLGVPIFDQDLMALIRSQPNLERLQVYIHKLGAMECRVIWTAHKQKYLQKLRKLSIGFVTFDNLVEEQRRDAIHWATEAIAVGWDLSMLGSSTVTNRLTQLLQPTFMVHPLAPIETIDMFDRSELVSLSLDSTKHKMRGCAWIHSCGMASAGGVDPNCLRSIGGRGQVEDLIRRGTAHTHIPARPRRACVGLVSVMAGYLRG
ncbi:hypothetical protein C8R43DRAFT_1132430 [Mycena crocata]|nr:hypothetical protein C8R43DRAFT_1132430 [Mycena crocata]